MHSDEWICSVYIEMLRVVIVTDVLREGGADQLLHFSRINIRGFVQLPASNTVMQLTAEWTII